MPRAVPRAVPDRRLVIQLDAYGQVGRWRRTVSPACRQEAGNAGGQAQGQEAGLGGWGGLGVALNLPSLPGSPAKREVHLFTFRGKAYFPFLSLSCETD